MGKHIMVQIEVAAKPLGDALAIEESQAVTLLVHLSNYGVT